MRVNPEIHGLLQELLSIQLVNGIQPSELADAVFEDPYQSIEMTKDRDSIRVTVTFVDDDDDDGQTTRHRMRYLYAPNKRLMRIEQKVGSKSFRVQWDREDATQRVLKSLTHSIGVLNGHASIEHFLSSVPDEVTVRLRDALRDVG